jgi:anti-sigma B factor antagonist
VNQVLSLQSRAEEHYVLVRIGGELDIATAPAVRDFLLNALAARRARLVVDVARVEFVDSTGAGALIVAGRNAVDDDGWVRLASPNLQMRRVLRLLQVTALLPIFDTVSHAATAGLPGAAGS